MAAGDADRLKRKMADEAARRLAEIDRAASTQFRAGRDRFLRTMTREHLTGPTSASALSRRTGQLARSLFAIVIQHPTAVQMTGGIGGGVPYARIHEDGGVVRPKKSKYLAIPLGPAKTAAGVLRAGPRAWPTPLKFIKTKRGTKLLVEAFEVQRPAKFGGWGGSFAPGKTVRVALRTAKAKTIGGARRFKLPGGQYATVNTPKVLAKGSLRPVFLLVDSVSIPPRMNFRRTFEVEARRTLERFKADVARIAGGGK